MRPSISFRSFRFHSGLALSFCSAMLLIAGCNKSSLQPPSQNSAASQSSDSNVAGRVKAQLQGDSALNSLPIQTQVNNGVVTLSGQVNDEAARELAANDAAQVNGVRTVINNLTVQAAAPVAVPPPPVAVENGAEAKRAAAAKKQEEAAQLRQQRRQQARARREQQQAEEQQQAANQPPTPVVNDNPQSQMQSAAPLPPVQPPPPPPQPITQTLTIPAGTDIAVRITETLETGKTKTNDAFHGALADSLSVNGLTAIRRGASVTGVVVDAKDAGHFKGYSEITLQLQNIHASNKDLAISTDPLIRKGKARGKDTAIKAGGGALFGTLLGALAGGGKGALLGAAAGAGAGTGVNAVTHGQQITIPSESVLHFKLSQPVKVTVTSIPGEQPNSSNNGGSPQLQQPNN